MITYTPQLIYKDNIANLFQVTIETDFIVTTEVDHNEIQKELLTHTLHRFCQIYYDQKSKRLIIRVTENPFFKGIRIADYQYYDYEKGYELVTIDGAEINLQNPAHFIKTNAEGFSERILKLHHSNSPTFNKALRIQTLRHKTNKEFINVPKVPTKKRLNNKNADAIAFHFERYKIQEKLKNDKHTKHFAKQPHTKYEIVATTKEKQPRVVGVKRKTLKSTYYNICLYVIIAVFVISAFIAGTEYIK